MRACILGLALAVACKSGDKPADPAPSTVNKVDTGSGSGSGSGSAAAANAKTKKKHEKAPATAAQKKTYKDKMKAGWAAQKAKKWADAVPAFEAALVAIPSDQRALAELGWSAMNAGDFKKAREADEQAVAVAIDSKVKASALFNLGTVKEKTGDKDGALKAYVASLALRPNKTVEQAVGKLGADAKQVAEAPRCAAADPCTCLKDDDDGHDPHCEADDTPPTLAGFKKWSISVMYGSEQYLFDDAGHELTELGHMYEHGQTYLSIAPDKLEKRKVGTHDVLWITKTEEDEEVEYQDNDSQDTDHELSRSVRGTLVTVCVLDKVPRCPLEDVPQSRTVTIDDDPKTAKKRELALDLAADGTLTIKLIGGASDDTVDALIGPHKLW